MPGFLKKELTVVFGFPNSQEREATVGSGFLGTEPATDTPTADS